MLGLYICHGEISRECVLAETTFVPGHEVSPHNDTTHQRMRALSMPIIVIVS